MNVKLMWARPITTALMPYARGSGSEISPMPMRALLMTPLRPNMISQPMVSMFMPTASGVKVTR